MGNQAAAKRGARQVACKPKLLPLPPKPASPVRSLGWAPRQTAAHPAGHWSSGGSPECAQHGCNMLPIACCRFNVPPLLASGRASLQACLQHLSRDRQASRLPRGRDGNLQRGKGGRAVRSSPCCSLCHLLAVLRQTDSAPKHRNKPRAANPCSCPPATLPCPPLPHQAVRSGPRRGICRQRLLSGQLQEACHTLHG